MLEVQNEFHWFKIKEPSRTSSGASIPLPFPASRGHLHLVLTFLSPFSKPEAEHLQILF